MSTRHGSSSGGGDDVALSAALVGVLLVLLNTYLEASAVALYTVRVIMTTDYYLYV